MIISKILEKLLYLEGRRQSGRRRRQAQKKLRGLKESFKLHVGCGEIRFPGWVHLDANSSLQGIDALWYSDDGLPFDNGTCEFIYNEHFLEHLTVAQGQYFLKECCRVLRPGGVLRVAMPDLREPVRQYWEQDWRNQPWMEKHGYTWIQTGCEMLNIAFRDWEHKWLYDREELRRRLNEAGFTTICDVEWNQSDHAELRNRETRPETLLICEARS